MNLNRPKLKSNILELLKRPVYNNLEINSKGNFVNVLKDKEKLYLLIIPNKALSEKESIQFLNLGFKEKFSKTNYSKFIDYNNSEVLEKLFDDIIYIFNSIFQIPPDREWRFSNSSGMRLLKEMSPISTAFERRNTENKKSFNLKKLFKYDILLSVIVGIGLSIFLIKNVGNFGLTKPVLILFSVLFSFVAIKFFKFINWLIDKLKRKRLFTFNKVSYFRNLNFKQVGNRFRGERNGYRVDIYNSFDAVDIAVYHEEIPWKRVVKLSESIKQVCMTDAHVYWDPLITKSSIDSRLFMPSSETIIEEADKLTEKLIELNIRARS